MQHDSGGTEDGLVTLEASATGFLVWLLRPSVLIVAGPAAVGALLATYKRAWTRREQGEKVEIHEIIFFLCSSFAWGISAGPLVGHWITVATPAARDLAMAPASLAMAVIGSLLIEGLIDGSIGWRALVDRWLQKGGDDA